MVHLKRMEAHGFKSFAEKINIKFDTGVTAVVGPNGSGKSNITDAIRFVLGEQSAKTIRGSNMQDVIFNGTNQRQQMNQAEVKLVLNNASRDIAINQDEIEITRKLLRNGDSSYFINKEKTKLKDIHELFLDSGLGKHAYNIISQGQVEEVLKSKPIERRRLIEEAAGVMKYKTRKKESEKKLEDTKANLSRINDIISELEGRVTTLERESAIAKEYLALKDEIKESDIEVTVYDIDTYAKKKEETKQQLSHVEKEISEAKTQLKETDRRLNELLLNDEASSNEYKRLNDELLEQSRKKEQLNGQIELFKEREMNYSESEKQLNERINQLTKRKDELKSQMKEKETDLNHLNELLNETSQSLKSINFKIKTLTGDKTTEIESLKNAYFEKMAKKTSLENEARHIENERERNEARLTQKREKVETLKTSIQEDTLSRQAKTDELNEKKDALNDVRNSYKEKKQLFTQLQSNYDDAKENLKKATEYIDQSNARLRILEQMQNDYQGYFPGVRHILKQKDQLNGVIDAVTNLIDTDPKYITALDTALGAQSQNIVVKTEREAKDVIQLLKRKKLGFATFLPVDVIKKRQLSHDIKHKLNDIEIEAHVLSDVVNVDETYRHIIEHLLGVTIVTNDIDDGTALAQALSYRVRIVTLEGETIMPGGALSGGSKSNQSSVLETKKEVKTLKDKLHTYSKKRDIISREVSQLKSSLTDVMMETDELKSSGEKLRETVDRLTHQRDQLNYQLEVKQESLLELESEVDTLNTIEDTHIDEEIQTLNRELDEYQSKIKIYSQSDKDKREQLNQLNETKSQFESKKMNQHSQIAILSNQKDSLLKDLNETNKALETHSKSMKLLYENNSELKIDELIEKQHTVSQNIETISQSIKELSEVQSHRRQTQKELNTLKQHALNLINEKQEEIISHSNLIEKLNTQLDQKLNYLSENYKVTYEMARLNYTSFNDIDRKRKNISLNKRSIEELGSVNLNSIEEYDAVNTRYTFLKSQEHDLLTAHETLTNVIREMDETVCEKFKTVFHEVNHHFGVVFKEMFGGGHAEIRLTNDGDYLESGIEIYAQPPGKRMHALTLLSGGERALTTISLLFSILKVRVSPFIILDEVEAALDEQNVLRFGEYLQQLSKETQFIVITHRKGTMEYSDRLFGVTMTEGVSQLIHVDLNDYEN